MACKGDRTWIVWGSISDLKWIENGSLFLDWIESEDSLVRIRIESLIENGLRLLGWIESESMVDRVWIERGSSVDRLCIKFPGFCLAMVWAHAKPPAEELGVRDVGWRWTNDSNPNCLCSS